MLAGLRDRFPRVNLLRLHAGADREEGLAALPAPVHHLPLPWPVPSFERRFVKRLKPVLALLGLPLSRQGWAMAERLRREGAAVVAVAPDAASIPPWQHRRLQLVLTGQASLSGATPGAPPTLPLDAPAAIVEALARLMPEKRQRQRGGLRGTLVERYGDLVLPGGPLALLTRRKYHEVRSLEALQERLGRPNTILCLGNGPSSEAPELAGLAWDCCFRVNHSWLGRGRGLDPQLVFTSARTSIETLDERLLLGFPSRGFTQTTLKRYLLDRRRLSYFCAEALGTVDFAGFDKHVPTNGAVMLATAVALAPARLIVAGIDLFNDPAGAYPGDRSTPNAYTVYHDRALEQAFIVDRLAAYRGQLVVLGQVLRAALAAAAGPAAADRAGMGRTQA